ncbi:hypothetical protein EMIHUDRAFT_452770 [Emiliania huxleyi CCMP1516]|uniref:Rhodanese domain-containing protein n=2 Tax=Emiliania huxleyi TaxID=2903 RepID=A0A0D3IFG3_EMIH1|nr:hypothetical protein EMIHUDRAFT_452770 [Emiliania huxleyi CCMP1516]EOD09998.1 hypothetical protein EMIHUDRAFT_452770 [Emiliania huxleyi CCMP1516]|eukprot:XP_005762427.1 hypothetical protein EMIHUDRAFT_452770 [Emiliania huxleyi CCMP1516]
MCELHVDDLLAALACDDAEGTPPALLRLTEEIQAAAGRLDVHSFLDAADRGVPVLDVRSPSEYAQGHVPGAASVPLFSDDERARVGTLYHAAGRSAAMELGMRLVRPKLGWLVERAAELLAVARASGESSGAVLVHCWRGGLRSGAVAWLLRQHGIEARTLGGGYKAFRAWATAYWGSVEMPPKHARTRAVVDLEGLARHRGSAFGWVGTVEAGGGAQPSSEHFTNLLACEWRRLEARGEAKGGRGRGWVFLEDEDSHIGHVSVPKPVYAALRCAPLVVRVSLPEQARVRLLLDDYVAGHADGPAAGEWLARMEESLTKRLGAARVGEVVAAMRAGDFSAVAVAMLHYYDKLYDAHLANHGGTGSGGGSRAGRLVEVAPADPAAAFDADELAGLVLRRAMPADRESDTAMMF